MGVETQGPARVAGAEIRGAWLGLAALAVIALSARPAIAGEGARTATISGDTTATATASLTAREPESATATATATEPESATASAADTQIEEVVVHGRSVAAQRRESAEAVTVLETTRAKRESSDMGEVLARTQGVGVRRSGGLGSGTRFSLNGLTDDQVRFFLDGVPLDLAGYSFGISNVPVGIVERIEIYSGVVPVRFGADALGGAVNVVSDGEHLASKLAATYEAGSFETHRLTLSGRFLDDATGLFTRASGFYDYAKNDYPVDVEVADERGRLSEARAYRFHDAYRAGGFNAEVGLVDRSWAERISIGGFFSSFDKEYQHDVAMTVPYGGVRYGEQSGGVRARYRYAFVPEIEVTASGGYSYTRSRFVDVATCVYDWFGRCVRERATAGETGTRPYDQVYGDHSAFGRAVASWQIAPSHGLHLSIAPTFFTRTGDERRPLDPHARDPLTAERTLISLVNGLEYELELGGDRFENIAFAKQYLQVLHSEEPRPNDVFRRRDRRTLRFGVGDGLRFRITRELYLKASYEWATRFPSPDEIFGDNVFVVANLELAPELSHNLNVGLVFDGARGATGTWRGSANTFLRNAEQLIVLLGSDRIQSYQNVYGARSMGVEATAGWTSPYDYVELDLNATYLDLRNIEDQGTFAEFDGDRVPNRPYFFANGSARFLLHGLFAPDDELSCTWSTRYVHEYFRGWESVGLLSSKQTIPAQAVHGIGFGYEVRGEAGTLTTTLEIQNLTDEPVFDFFGVQRPGRAIYIKTTAEL